MHFNVSNFQGLSMHRGLSLYLDVIRIVAATEVFVYHLIALTNPLGYEPGWASFGHEAVVAFFVLSGYVISYAASHRDRTLRRFMVSRVIRIYPVGISALLLTLVLEHFGYPLNHVVYHGFAPLHSPLARFVISFLMVNETWFSVQAFSDGPFWSVCYELVYYVIFGAYYYFSGRIRGILVVVCLLLAGPRPLLLLPIWVMGSWAFFETHSGRWRPTTWWILFLLPLPTLWVYTTLPLADITVRIAVGVLGWGDASMDLGHSRQVLSDIFLGAALALHFLGAKNLGPVLERGLSWLTPILRTVADYTFTLYMVHLPVLLFMAATFGMGTPRTTLAIVLAVVGVTALFGFAIEHQRHRLKRSMAKLVQ